MTQRDALLRAVCAAPDDDLPRLVFADWCEEHGEADRGQFIRLMCRIHELCRAIDRGAGEKAMKEMNPLDRRAWRLWETHGRGWFAELPKLAGITWPNGRWPRGFAPSVTAVTVGTFLRHADTIAAAIPLIGLTLKRVHGVTALLRCPHLRTVRVLTMTGAGVTDRMADELCGSPALDGVKVLQLVGNRLSPAAVRRLTKRFGTRVSAHPQRRG
jgi:uncharacterized protein (TIGR02996 family)